VGVELGAILHHVGGDPHGLACGEIGCLAVECHDAWLVTGEL